MPNPTSFEEWDFLEEEVPRIQLEQRIPSSSPNTANPRLNEGPQTPSEPRNPLSFSSSTSNNPQSYQARSSNPSAFAEITTSLKTLKKLLHFDLDLGDRRTTFNKKRLTTITGHIRTKTMAICQMILSNREAFSGEELMRIVESVAKLRAKRLSPYAKATLVDIDEVIAELVVKN